MRQMGMEFGEWTLVFGCRYRNKDFLYKEELLAAAGLPVDQFEEKNHSTSTVATGDSPKMNGIHPHESKESKRCCFV